MSKPMTILMDEMCQLTREVLPQWRFCRDLAVRLNGRVDGISIRFESVSAGTDDLDVHGLNCEFRWRNKPIGIVETSFGSNSAEIHIKCDKKEYSVGVLESEWVWRKLFLKTITEQISKEVREIQVLEQQIAASFL